MSTTENVTRPARHTVDVIKNAFAEANSFALMLSEFEKAPGRLRYRNEIRKHIYRLRNDIDALQQAIDELSYGLSDFEVADDLEFSDHGHAPKADF